MNDIFEKFSPKLMGQKSSQNVDSDMQNFETLLGKVLPERLRSLLISIGGAISFENAPYFVPIEKSGWEDIDDCLSITFIFGIGDGGKCLAAAKKMYRDQLPENIIPIADAEGGNLLCLDTVTNQVVFWDHEALPGRKNIFLVAESFDEFEKNLKTKMDVNKFDKSKVLKASLRF